MKKGKGKAQERRLRNIWRRDARNFRKKAQAREDAAEKLEDEAEDALIQRTLPRFSGGAS